jgi:hypothetical protein
MRGYLVSQAVDLVAGRQWCMSMAPAEWMRVGGSGMQMAGEATDAGQENRRYQPSYQEDQEQRVHLVLASAGRCAASRPGVVAAPAFEPASSYTF